MDDSANGSPARLTGERADLVESLDRHRHFLRYAVRDLTEEQARRSPTASALNLGGLIKHVTATEAQWMRFAVGGAEAMMSGGQDWAGLFQMTGSETLPGLLDAYDAVARHTNELVATLDLDASQPLPQAPWFEPGASWSVRRVVLHVLAETSQHAGHADIIRESIDGQKTMG